MHRLTGLFNRVTRAAKTRTMSVASTLEDIRSKEHDIDKYLYLRNLQRCGAENLGIVFLDAIAMK